MSEKYEGRLMARVTANGCGLPLSGAVLSVNGKKYTVPNDRDGFSEIIILFSSASKGEKKSIALKAVHPEFESLTVEDIPITSGYLTVWNMPLEPKVKENQKAQKNKINI